VTLKADADCPVVNGACNLTGGPTNANGTTDANVLGGTSGKSGAIREFIRFVCRGGPTSSPSTNTKAADPDDTYTGTTDYTGVGNIISNSGFTLIPTTLRTPGSNCDVNSVG
jgi:hypothetical protein